MQPRRRLPLLAGMALSTVIIAAPAAHADDFLRPRQDCSVTRVQQAHRGGVVGTVVDLVASRGGRIEDIEIRNREENENIRTTDVSGDEADINIRRSFNCSSAFNRSFRHKFRERRHHGDGHNDWFDKR